MSTFSSPLTRTLHRWIATQAPALSPDHELLERFLSTGDQQAFANLVERHGRLVLRLCRRWLPDSADAEDAFQATFLVLARKAAAVRRRESLAAWLHGVAYRIAHRMQAAAARRRAAERNACPPAGGDPDVSWREACAALDEELQRLPEAYRQPLVLFYLQGQLQDAIAAQLGCSPRTLRRRLDRGREMLRLRLARRGIQLAAVLLAVEVSATAVPAALTETTIVAAGKFAAGEAAAISARVLSLANAALATAATARWALAATVILAAGMLGVGAAAVALPAAAEPAGADNAAVAPRPDDVLAFTIDREGKITAVGCKEALKDAAEIKTYLKRRYDEAAKAAAGGEVRTTIRITADADAYLLSLHHLLKASTAVGFRTVEIPAFGAPLDIREKPKAAALLIKTQLNDGVPEGKIGALIVQTADGETSLVDFNAVGKYLAQIRGNLLLKDELQIAADSYLSFRHVVEAAAVGRKAGFRQLHLVLPPDVEAEERAPSADPAVAKAKPHGPDEAGRRAAVAAGLAWLARHQSVDGSWSMHQFHKAGNCQCSGPGSNEPIAGTAFGLLPLLRAGETHKGKGPRGKNVERGLRYLVAHQTADGQFSGNMYANGLASLAVCEAYGLTADPPLKGPARRAVNFIVNAQHDEGGWRYQPRQPGDLSVTVWQVHALGAARSAGLNVNEQTWTKLARFLDSVAYPDGKGYSYLGFHAAKPTMTACGLFCRLSLPGSRLLSVRDRKALDGLRGTAPRLMEDLYGSFHRGEVMNRDVGDGWAWNRQARRQLVELQDWGEDPKHPCQKGSWSPRGQLFGENGGRVMMTSLALLTLLAADRPAAALPSVPGTKPSVIDSLWDDLGKESAVALPAERTLSSAPAQAVPFLRERLRPVPRPDAAQIARWIADLGSPQFAVRQQATSELEKLGELAETALRKLVAGKPTLEARTRAERLLAGIDATAPTPEQLRALRAIRVLERIGTPEARKALEVLAGGAAEARVTQEAQRAIDHLDRRQSDR